MKVVLLGYMASGKTIIASNLSEKYAVEHIDLDVYISEKENLSISEIFKTKGEIAFRLLENKYLIEIFSNKERFILSVGGGTPCYANNMELILAHTKSFYLHANINTIFNRIVNEKEKRPLVSEISNDKLKEFIAKHLFERAFFYNKAKFTLQVDNKNVEEIVDEIDKLL